MSYSRAPTRCFTQLAVGDLLPASLEPKHGASPRIIEVGGVPILGIDMYKGCISTASPYTALGPGVDTLLISTIQASPDTAQIWGMWSRSGLRLRQTSWFCITRHLQLGQESILFVDSSRRGKEGGNA